MTKIDTVSAAPHLSASEPLEAPEREVLVVGALSEDVLAQIETAEYGVEAR